jgi:hypothetical protein
MMRSPSVRGEPAFGWIITYASPAAATIFAHRFEKDRVRASGEQRLDLHSKIYLAVDTFAPRTDAVPLAILDDLSDEMSRSLR